MRSSIKPLLGTVFWPASAPCWSLVSGRPDSVLPTTALAPTTTSGKAADADDGT